MMVRNSGKIGLLVAALCLVFVVFPITAQAATYYVDGVLGTNTPGNGGSPGAGAWKTITYALNQVSGTHTIHVAAGTYASSTNGETFPLNMEAGITLVGDGGPAATILDGNNTSQIMIIEDDYGVVVDGFTFTRGYTYFGSGAAIAIRYYDTAYCSATIQNCIIIDNETAGSSGGGVSLSYLRSYTTKFINCTIAENTAVYGGGVDIYDCGSWVEFYNCTITGNHATDYGYSTEGSGGGLFLARCTAEIVNSIIQGNTSNDYQGYHDVGYDYYDPGSWYGYYCKYDSTKCSTLPFGGTGNRNNTSLPAFVGGSDYHLLSSDTQCRNYGTSTKPATRFSVVPPTTDIDGESRPNISDPPSVYDIGSDEYYLAAGPTCVDDDGDGYGVCPDCGTANGCTYDGNDCDDTDEDINPGATEVCDGVDNDCDTIIDPPGSDGCTTYFKDSDDDDYGVTGDTQCLCAPSGDYTATEGGDCNDGDDTIYPGAPETLCDGIDQDCSGADDCPCVDSDGDGYGVCPDCGTVNGCTYDGDDCNDGDDTIYPGATEVACDGIDQDCSGADDCDAGHVTHTGGAAKGPDALACTDCHIDDTPALGEDFADGEPFATTTVCDDCHSPGGAFDGVDDATIGAKANWPDGVYEADGETLSSGKEQWCGTCHDDVAASSRPGPGVEVIVDNPDATFVCTWGTSASGGYNGDYRWHAAGSGSCTATWTPNLPAADTYNVRAWWKASTNRATNAKYTIHYNGGSETVEVNQQINGNQWNLLGTYPFAAGTSGYVVLSDDANQYIIADAVKFDNGSLEVSINAPNVTGDDSTYGFYVNGHNIDCLSCHDAGKEHIDHQHRTYDADVTAYGDSYRLKVPSTKPSRYLCFVCHNSTEVLGQTSSDVSHTNFWNNDSYVENSHWLHVGLTGVHFDSDWDGVVDSTESCITCHNTHGSPSPAMIRHGELISTYGTTDKVPALNFAYLGPDLENSTGGRMNYAGPGVGQNGVCWACHSAISYYRTPYLGPKVMALPVDDPVANDGSGTAIITVFVSDPDGDVSTVEIDLTPIGGSANQAMTDNLDGTYSYLVTIPATTPDSTLTFKITATDAAANTGKGAVTLIIVDPDGIYVDNADAALVCDWGISSTGGYGAYGGAYRWHAAGTGSCTATWTPDVPSAETYNVYAWWKASSNRATNAKYTIYHDSGSQTVEVNQEIGGSQWNYLGNFSFAAGTSGYVVLSDDANEYVIADAIKLTPSAPPSPETVIVDNPDAQFVCYWGTSSTGGYNDYYRWHAAGTGSCTATWTPNLVAGASYSVYAWWKASPNRATDSPYTIVYDGGSVTVDVNQQINGNQWVLLGTYPFVAGQSGYVVLSDDANQYVIADAVKFEP